MTPNENIKTLEAAYWKASTEYKELTLKLIALLPVNVNEGYFAASTNVVLRRSDTPGSYYICDLRKGITATENAEVRALYDRLMHVFLPYLSQTHEALKYALEPNKSYIINGHHYKTHRPVNIDGKVYGETRWIYSEDAWVEYVTI